MKHYALLLAVTLGCKSYPKPEAASAKGSAAATPTAGAPAAPAGPVATDTQPAAEPATKASTPEATLRSDAPTTTGSLPREDIRRVVATAAPRLRACYEKALAKNPKLAGTVMATFVIDRSGKVSEVQTDGSTLTDGSVLSCVAGVVSKLQFPEPSGGVVQVAYPFVFRPI